MLNSGTIVSGEGWGVVGEVVGEGVGVCDGIWVGVGVDIEGDDVCVDCGVLNVIELLTVVIKPALSFIWQ
jgi:hypothetical protein